MLTAMVAKLVGDLKTHSYFHTIIEFKGLPYLYDDAKIDGLHSASAQDLMASPAIVRLSSSYSVQAVPGLSFVRAVQLILMQTIREVEKVGTLAKILDLTTHNGFPVSDINGYNTFRGLLLRPMLEILLRHPEIFTRKKKLAPKKFLSYIEIKKIEDSLENKRRVWYASPTRPPSP